MLRVLVAALLTLLAAAPLARAAEGPPPLKPLTRVGPDYPPEAWRLGLDGKVSAKLTVDGEGHVAGTEILLEEPKGHGFAGAATAALRQWLFPAGQTGTYQVTMNFAFEPVAEYTPEAAALPEAEPVKRTPLGWPKDCKAGRAIVVLAVTIDEEGERTDARVLQESPAGFGEVALRDTRKWDFRAGKPGLYRLTLGYDAKAHLTPDEAKLPGAPRPIKRKRPTYPRKALERMMTGVVETVVTIRADGTVENVRVANEQPPGYGFGEASVDAIKQWVFPAVTPGYYTVTVNFSIDGMSSSGPDVVVDFDNLPPAPEPSSRRTPNYPDDAEEKGIEGSADLAVQINDSGRVTNVAVISETPEGMEFGRAAFESVTRWRFEGTPEGAYRVHVEFKLGANE